MDEYIRLRDLLKEFFLPFDTTLDESIKNEMFNVLGRLIADVYEIKQGIAAFEANNLLLEEGYAIKQNAFLFTDLANRSIDRETMRLISSFFDNAYTGRGENENKKNCTLLYLKRLMLHENYSHVFPGGEENELVKRLSNLQILYKELFGDMRDKKIAHQSFDSVMNPTLSLVFLEDEKELVLGTERLLNEVCTRVYGNEFTSDQTTYDEWVEQYKASILEVMEKVAG